MSQETDLEKTKEDGPIKAIMALPIDSISKLRKKQKHNANALKETKKKLKKLESKANKLSVEKIYSGNYLSDIAALRKRVRELEEENGTLALTIAQDETLTQHSAVANATIPTGSTSAATQFTLSPITKVPLSSYLKDIWILRALAVGSTMVVALLLMAYSYLFISTYFALGNTTSYFPWAWGRAYTTFSAVQNLFVGGFAISFVAMICCAYLMWSIIPSLRRAMAKIQDSSSLAPAPGAQ
jgi:hypothetical protein